MPEQRKGRWGRALADWRMRRSISRRSRTLLRRLYEGGMVSDTEIATLRRLDLLARLDDGLNLSGVPALLLVLGVIVALVSLLLLSVRSTEVTLDVRVSSVAFTLDERQPLISRRNLLASSLYADGLRTVRLPAAEGGEPVWVADPGAPVSLRLQVETAGAGAVKPASVAATPKASLTLGPPVLDSGQSVRISTFGDGFDCVLELPCGTPAAVRGAVSGATKPRSRTTAESDGGNAGQCPDVELTVLVSGQASYWVDPAPPSAAGTDWSFPRAPGLVTLRTQGDETPTLRLRLLPDSDVLTWQARVRDLSLADLAIMEVADARNVVRRYSTIESGTLSFPTIPGRQRRLQRGEELLLAVKTGVLHSVELEDGWLHVSFHGTVSAAGVSSNPDAFMPSYLDEWSVKGSFRVLSGLLLSLLMVLMGLRRMLEVDL